MVVFSKRISVCIIFLVVMFLLNLSAWFSFVAGLEHVGAEVRGVNVYVVCLDGVEAGEVCNVSRVFEGVLLASKVERIRYLTGESVYEGMFPRLAMGEIPINVSVTVITDWTAYKILVEYGVNIIIVNAHGEILPVPNGYGPEGWIDRIAEAMLSRNVTWVHVAGYPLRYRWRQETGKETWGEEGFRRLMSRIGKNNVTCYPPEYHEVISLSVDAEYNIKLDWAGFYHAYWVSWGYPLNGTVFGKLIVKPSLYGSGGAGDPYYVADVVKFAKDVNETRNFGFYVHFGAGQTYEYFREKITERDFYGGYAAAAVAIRANIMKVASLEAIHQAEAAVTRAELEGRTKGLEKAVNLLREAKEDYLFNSYDEVLRETYQTKKAAEEAVNPSFLESHGLLLGVLSIGVAAAGGLAIGWRNNRRKNSCREHGENENI